MKEKIPALSYFSRERLSGIFRQIPGKKDLIIDGNIIKALENVIRTSVLRSFNVDKMYKMTNSDISSTSTIRVFLIYADLITVKRVCDHVNAETSKSSTTDVKFYLILVPRKLFSVMQLLEEEGVYEYITVFPYSWELISLCNDSVLSLELKYFFSDLFVNGDQSLLPVAAKSIWSSLLLFGNPSVRISIGSHSQSVCQMIDEYSSQICKLDRSNSHIDYCIVVDRDVDYVSTLLTPTTYTSLLDEVFCIKSGFVELIDGLVISLNSQEIYSQIKDRHFAHVISFLKDKAKKIQEEYEASQKLKIQEMKNYIKQNLINLLEQKKSLSQHISACELIIKKLGDHFEQLIGAEENILTNSTRGEVMSFIEDSLSLRTIEKYSILRLLCLLSTMQNGISLEEANRLKVQFFNAYGYQFLPVFHNLEKLGLFVTQPTLNLTDITASSIANRVAQAVPLSAKKTTMQQMIHKMKLLPNKEDGSNLKNPSTMNYVFSGMYTPAICQLLYSLHSGEMTKEDIPKYFIHGKVHTFSSSSACNTFFVYFVGGVTYAEVAAFQLFEKLSGCQVIVAATNTINGNLICEACSQ